MFSFNNLKVSKKISLGYSIILFLMLIVSIVVYSSISSIITSTKWVDHTHTVIRTAEQVSASLINIETGLRGFVITGEDDYLQPYEDGVNRFSTLINAGQELTSDNPAQVARWKEVAALKSQLIKTVAEPEIQARREVNQGADALANFKQISNRIVGKEIFDSVRAVLASMEATSNG